MELELQGTDVRHGKRGTAMFITQWRLKSALGLGVCHPSSRHLGSHLGFPLAWDPEPSYPVRACQGPPDFHKAARPLWEAAVPGIRIRQGSIASI